MDYQQELDKYQAEITDGEKQDLQKLVGMQKDVAIGDSAEDFIRHPFFRKFEQQMNAMINDAGGEIVALLNKPGTTVEDLKALQAGINKMKELKRWLNKHVIAGRVARQAITLYEQDTEEMNAKIQAAVDASQK